MFSRALSTHCPETCLAEVLSLSTLNSAQLDFPWTFSQGKISRSLEDRCRSDPTLKYSVEVTLGGRTRMRNVIVTGNVRSANARTAIRVRVALRLGDSRASVQPRFRLGAACRSADGWVADGGGVRVFLYLIIILGRGSEAIA